MRAGELQRETIAIFAAAGLAVTANAARQSLPSLDDCFYARKGIEMARAGRISTVTWSGQPTFQNPPLQIFLLARSFALLGENDLAARLPSAALGIGLLGIVYWLGRRIGGAQVAATAVALLAVTPLFVNHARRCMLEIPLAFWIALFFAILVEGERRPRLLAWLAVPLGAALLTKSVLGLLPLFVLGAAGLDKSTRRWLATPWFWAGAFGGLVIGASWPVHQYAAHGPEALRAHYVREIAERSTAGLGALQVLTAYPLALLASYQPLILPALGGLASLWRRGDRAGRLLGAWLVVPIVLYSFSSARSPRYLFPTLPAMALIASLWLCRSYPKTALWARRSSVVLLLAASAIFWLKPSLLSRPGNDGLKQQAEMITAEVPETESLPYYGTRYWGIANPLLYYAERRLEPSAASAAQAVVEARQRPSRVLVVDRDRLAELEALARVERFFESGDWLVVRLSDEQLGDRRR